MAHTLANRPLANFPSEDPLLSALPAFCWALTDTQALLPLTRPFDFGVRPVSSSITLYTISFLSQSLLLNLEPTNLVRLADQ